jgi:hypothetical protein
MPDSTVKFNNLRIEGWRQFDNIDIDFHPSLTVLTGANGAGKTTLLRVLSSHFGINADFLATPVHGPSGRSYVMGIFDSFWKKFTRQKRSRTDVGTISYTNGNEAWLQLPNQSQASYIVEVGNRQPVVGFHIDSHQAVSRYQPVGQIASDILSPAIAYQKYNAEIFSRHQGGHTGFSPLYRMKEAIISMAIFGEGNKHIEGNPQLLRTYVGFVDALRTMLPSSLGFRDLAVRPPEVVLMTKSGEFILDASSGGIITLIDLTWRLYMFSLDHPSFVVTIDEPENHLHPTMQRSLMGKLIETFPGTQFIIGTHSPFMVSSIKDSNVFVLRYLDSNAQNATGESLIGAQSRVVSERLEKINKAGSAGDILRDVLGVSATMPEWVERELKDIISQYSERPLNADTLRLLRGDLASLGFDEYYPEALASITEGK